MVEGKLFEPSSIELWGEERPRPAKTRRGEARVNRPQRDQIEWTQVDAETLIPEDHVARAIWSYLDRMELSAFYESVKSVAGRPRKAGHGPPGVAGVVDAGHRGRRGQRPPAGPSVPGAQRLPVAQVERARQLSHALGLPGGEPEVAWTTLLTQVVATLISVGHGESEAGGPGRDAGGPARGRHPFGVRRG